MFPAAQLLQRKIHNMIKTVVWVVKSKGRQQKPTAPTAARLIGCGGRAAAAAAAVVHTTSSFFAVFLARNNGVPTALLCAILRSIIIIHSKVRGVDTG